MTTGNSGVSHTYLFVLILMLFELRINFGSIQYQFKILGCHSYAQKLGLFLPLTDSYLPE